MVQSQGRIARCLTGFQEAAMTEDERLELAATLTANELLIRDMLIRMLARKGYGTLS